jgi:hypothetical protein
LFWWYWVLNSGIHAWITTPAFFLWLFWRQGFTFWPGPSEPQFSYFLLASILRQQAHTTMPTCKLRRSLKNSMPKLASNCHSPNLASQVAKIIGIKPLNT